MLSRRPPLRIRLFGKCGNIPNSSRDGICALADAHAAVIPGHWVVFGLVGGKSHHDIIPDGEILTTNITDGEHTVHYDNDMKVSVGREEKRGYNKYGDTAAEKSKPPPQSYPCFPRQQHFCLISDRGGKH